MKRIQRRNGFTLAELIVSIAILAFFSTIIVQVFAQAQAATERAERLDQAVVVVSDLADQWKSVDFDQLDYNQIDPAMHRLWPAQDSQTEATLYLDEQFITCDVQAAVYEVKLTVSKQADPDFYQLDVVLTDLETSKTVYQLVAGRYFSGKGGDS